MSLASESYRSAKHLAPFENVVTKLGVDELVDSADTHPFCLLFALFTNHAAGASASAPPPSISGRWHAAFVERQLVAAAMEYDTAITKQHAAAEADDEPATTAAAPGCLGRESSPNV